MKYIYLLLIFTFVSFFKGYAQPNRPWNATWIISKEDKKAEYGVYCFRKTITLDVKPENFVIKISADNRYKLYVNGRLASLGPARGDEYSWNFDTVNISSMLMPGKNVIAALVWNEGAFRPEAQVSFRAGFIVQGNSAAEEVLNTNETWKAVLDEGRQPIPEYFFAASKGEFIDLNKSFNNWALPEFDDSAWPFAVKIADGKLKGMAWGLEWALVPSKLPPMELSYQRIPKLRDVSGISISAKSRFPKESIPVTIPPNTVATFLLDQTYETNAYFTMLFSKGKHAGISVGYAESLYEKEGNGQSKGNRNEIDGKVFIGRKDSLIANGSANQSFTTLNFRTFRYIKISVHTRNEELIINDVYGIFTAYPFVKASVFTTDKAEINKILDIGWRTARLNAWETYMDCPYYEQLQYVGDTRIQALVSYYNSSDDRLARNAITQIDHSRIPEGLTRSCYPSKGTQIIPPFSLWYIGMLYDYWMYRGDEDFIKDKLNGQRSILKFFSDYQQSDGSIKELPYWAFVDWAGDMWGKVKGEDGSAAIYDLQLLWAYQWAAKMEEAIGLNDYAQLYKAKSKQLKATIQKKYWNASRNLYADTREGNSFSQHVNSLAILTGMLSEEDMRIVAENVVHEEDLTQCSVYFKYYLHQALARAGMGSGYMSWLDIYRENIRMGLTTWAEYSDVNTSRSDCHAWGSSPNIEFFRVVLGIDSDAPGFKKVKIKPHLGSLTKVSGEIPHPNGKIAVSYALKRNKWEVNISLPDDVSGVFVWEGENLSLTPGVNKYVFNRLN